MYSIAFVLAGWGLSLWPAYPLVNCVTRGLGVISYSSYITHFAALDLVGAGLARVSAAGLPPPATLGLLLASTLALTVVMSLVTYHAIEVPSQHAGRWLIARIERQFAPPA